VYLASNGFAGALPDLCRISARQSGSAHLMRRTISHYTLTHPDDSADIACSLSVKSYRQHVSEKLQPTVLTDSFSTGSLFDLSGLTNLAHLDVRSNSLTGQSSLPLSRPSREAHILHTGSFPPSFTANTALASLYLSSNSYSGPFSNGTPALSQSVLCDAEQHRTLSHSG